MRTSSFHASDAGEWDRAVRVSTAATFLLSRRFLSYHGDRFEDASVVARDERGCWIAAIPAARDPERPDRVISHPGLTYGGVIHDGSISGAEVFELFTSVVEQFRCRGFTVWEYRPVPWIYHRSPAQDDIHALHRLGAQRVRCDLAVTVDLQGRRPPSERRRRGVGKARREGVVIERGWQNLEPYWKVLRSNLMDRYGKNPVHDEAEIRMLAAFFADEIELVVASRRGTVIGGTVLFHTERVSHVQYSAADAEGRQCCALDLVYDDCLRAAALAGRRYFDFGISTERGGDELNEGLHEFKHEFGGGATLYEAYELNLTGA